MNDTVTETLRPLPPGHDDEASAFYLKPEHREAYQVVQADQRQLREAIEAVQREAVRAKEMKVWEAHRRAKEKALSGSDYRQWLARHSHADGRPNLITVGELSGATRFGPDVKPLDPEQSIYAEFIAHRWAAVQQVEGLAVAAKAERVELLMRTCAVCSTVSTTTLKRSLETPAGETRRVCESCKDLLALARSAAAEVPAGGTRMDAIQHWLGFSRSPADATATTTGGLRKLLPGRR